MAIPKQRIEVVSFVELDLVGPVGCRSRRAQAVVHLAENAEKWARQATAAGKPCTAANELLDLRGRVHTQGARKLVGEALEYAAFGEGLRPELNRGAFRKAPAGLGLRSASRQDAREKMDRCLS